MKRGLYSALCAAIIPLALLRLAWRARRQPGYLQHVRERFGRVVSSQGPTLWLHAVSVGETRAAQPLIKALRGRFPEHDILLTHMTPTGRATVAELFGKDTRIRQSYLPYDLPWLMRRFMRRVQPQVGIVMETEVWPNALQAAQRAGTPTLLVNARLSERSARGYARLGQLARSAFSSFHSIGAQAAADAQRLQALGARSVVVTGNMKFDVVVDPTLVARGKALRQWAGTRPVLLAASTREGEEALLLDAFARLAPPEVLLVLVPRHPQRFDEVANLVTRAGLSLARRSAGTQAPLNARVLLGDSMGEMVAYYQMADICLMGGSWLPYGSQNLIEPCAVGRAVVLGPSTFNFADAASKAVAAGAARQCGHVDEGMTQALGLLADTAACALMADAGLRFTQAHRGATERTLALVEAALLASGQANR
jgi:3-deoxy-D-manno-octulosonic-acid transferase